jgi:hypothetical protein
MRCFAGGGRVSSTNFGFISVVSFPDGVWGGSDMPNNARSALLGASLFVMVLTAAARAGTVPPCTPPNNVSSTTSLNEVPAALRQALKQQVGDIVAPDEKFDATDVVITGRNRRLIFIWNVGKRWIVATEHGGRVYNRPIFAYDLSQDGQSATLVQEGVGGCGTALSLLGAGPP